MAFLRWAAVIAVLFFAGYGIESYLSNRAKGQTTAQGCQQWECYELFGVVRCRCR